MDKALEYWTLIREQFPLLLNISLNFISAILIFCGGVIVGRWVQKRVRKSNIGGRHIDATLKPILASILFYLIIAITIYAVLIKMGIPATSLIAVFGGAALAIGLALKDTLSNIASGIMLLFLRPLAVGELIDIGNTTGVVTEVGLFSTTLKTPEGIYQFIPNSKVWDTRIQNFGRHSIRQFRLDIGVSYDTNLRQAQEIIKTTMASAADGISENAPNPPEAFVVAFSESSVNFNCRVWLPSDNWMNRSSNLRIEIFEALGAAGIEIPFPQRVVTMKKD